MPDDTQDSPVRWLLSHRCAWLFFGLLLLLVGLPYVGTSMADRVIGAVLHDVILIAAAVVLSKSRSSLVIAIVLALPAFGFQSAAIALDEPGLFFASWMFSALFYLLTLAYLLRYVLSPEAMTLDKLYGAAAAYLMLGVLWYFAYGIVQHIYPGSFAVHGVQVEALSRLERIYFSFTTLTTTGFGDIAPVTPQARSLTNLESICGTLFVAILIARLVGVYPEAGKK